MTETISIQRPKPPSTGLVGRSIPRIDAYERVTGRAKYTGDWKVPGMLYGRIIMSSRPHAIVKSIDGSKALAMDGVEAILTCFDDKTVWHAGERIHERYVFTDHVRFIGDCIGAVAAKSRNLAQEAVAAVEVEYEDLPPVYKIDDAMKTDAPKIWDDGNIIGPLTFGFSDVEAHFKEADLIVEGAYSSARQNNAPLEPAVSLAWWTGDSVTVVAATQSIHGCREGLARDLNLPIGKVRVICLYKGGGFGNKNSSMNYDLVAALLARKTRTPVMVEYSRMEEFIGVHGRWSTVQNLRAAVRKKDYRMLAVDLKGYADIGAYTRHIVEGQFMSAAEDYYACEAWRGQAYGVYTNTPATAHTRAPQGPQSCFASESLVDEVAHRLQVDPVEFRLRNAVVKHHGTKKLTSNGLRECLKAGAETFGWRDKWSHPLKARDRMRKGAVKSRGVGVAMGAWHARLGKGEAILRLRKDGSLQLYTGVVDIGTGAKSIMAMIAADTFGVPLNKIEVVWGDTESCPYSIGESGGRTTTFTGTAVKAAAANLREKILTLASTQLKARIEELELRDGEVVHLGYGGGGSRIRVSEVLEAAGRHEIVEKTLTEPSLPPDEERKAFAAHFSEVEVDLETGQTKILRYVAAHDSGQIVNRLTARNQVEGAITMGLGMTFSEKLLIDPNYGMLQNPSFLNYKLPDNLMIPPIEVVFIETNDPYGPKSLGEVPIVPVPAAVGNAIFNATGVRLRDIPFNADALLRGIDEQV